MHRCKRQPPLPPQKCSCSSPDWNLCCSPVRKCNPPPTNYTCPRRLVHKQTHTHLRKLLLSSLADQTCRGRRCFPHARRPRPPRQSPAVEEAASPRFPPTLERSPFGFFQQRRSDGSSWLRQESAQTPDAFVRFAGFSLSADTKGWPFPQTTHDSAHRQRERKSRNQRAPGRHCCVVRSMPAGARSRGGVRDVNFSICVCPEIAFVAQHWHTALPTSQT